jgi:hypothetical protein
MKRSFVLGSAVGTALLFVTSAGAGVMDREAGAIETQASDVQALVVRPADLRIAQRDPDRQEPAQREQKEPDKQQPAQRDKPDKPQQPAQRDQKEPDKQQPAQRDAPDKPQQPAQKEREKPQQPAQRDQKEPQKQQPAQREKPEKPQQPAQKDREQPDKQQPAQREREKPQQPAQRDQKEPQKQQPAQRDQPDQQRTTVTLNQQQRTEISQAVTKVKVQPLTRVNFSVSVGTVVPRSVRLHPLPDTIVRVVPRFRGYRFILVEERIVIIEPRSYRIVEVIEVSDRGTRTAATGCSERIELTTEQRTLIRTQVLRGTAKVKGPGFRVEVGEALPGRIELRSFPETVVREVSLVRPCRFVVVEDQVVLVDPDARRIVTIID